MLGNKVSKKGWIYKMCQYAFYLLFHEKAPVASSTCGFFLQGVITGVIVFGSIPLGTIMYFAGLAELVGIDNTLFTDVSYALGGFVILPAITWGALCIGTCILLLFAVFILFVVLVLYTLGTITTLQLQPFEGATTDLRWKPTHNFWLPVINKSKAIYSEIKKIHSKFCTKVEWED